MSNANPSVDPSNQNTLKGAFREILKKFQQNTDGMLPATVVSYDRTSNRVKVQPAVKILGTNEEAISRAQISSIPVLRFGGGGFGISVNLRAGDTGLIFAADRDTSIFLQSYMESAPQAYRVKNFSDSFFIPDVMKDFIIDDEDTDNLVIQKADGSVRISLSEDTIKIVAPNIVIEGDVEIEGNLKVIGEITASGNITPNVPP